MMKYLKYLLLLSLMFLIPKTYALETTTIYSDINLNNSNKFLYTTSSASTGSTSTGTVGTVIADAGYGIRFYLNKGTSIGKVYKIRVNFNDYDWLTSNNSQVVTISNSLDSCNIIGYQNLNQGGGAGQSKNVEIMYQCLTASTSTIVVFGQYIEGSGYKRLTTINWRINSVQWEEVQNNNGSQDIIANNNTNTDNIINNNNQNTQNIINNQNQNTQNLIDSQKSCTIYDNSSISQNGKYLGSTGLIGDNSSYGISDYININEGSINVITTNPTSWVYACYYTKSKTVISCNAISNLSGDLTIPNNAYYFRSTIYVSGNAPQFKVCKNGNQASIEAQQETNDILTDDDIGGSADDAGDFITGFDTNTFGLTAIVTAPLDLIQSLTSSTCSQLELPLPYLNNKKIYLPCMTPIYQSTFGSLFTMYQSITFGIIAYWVCVRIFNMVKDFKNPEHDEIEVVDL